MTAVIPDEMREQMKAEASKLVKEAFSLATEEEKKKELEKHLVDSNEKLNEAGSRINELLDVAKAKDEELSAIQDELKALKEQNSADIEAKTKELSEKVSELEAKLAEADEVAKKLSEERDTFRASLESLEKGRVAEKRMAELAGEKVAFVDEDKAKAQVAKIREMSEEQFTEYKTELVSIRDLAVAAKEGASKTREVPPPARNSSGASTVQVELPSVTKDNVSERFAGLGEKMAEYSKTLVKTGSK